MSGPRPPVEARSVVQPPQGEPRPPCPTPSGLVHAERRARVAATLRSECAALLLYGGVMRTRSNDTQFRFRPDSDFHYLTGLAEPGAVMVLRPGEGADELKFTLFVRPHDRDAEVWSGRRIGPVGAIERYGATEAYPLAELDEKLPKLLDGCAQIYLPVGRWSRLDAALRRAVAHLRRRNREGTTPPLRYGEVADLLGEDRMRKDPAALASLRRATELSAAAHLTAMRRTKPGMFEYEIEALIEYEFRRCGSSGPGYASIVGTGDNATILHYVDNRDRLQAGDMLLVDAGAEWDYFTGDITRSWPVSGRFTPEQRAVYEVVLAANQAGIAKAVVGSNIDAIHAACVEVLCEGLADMGLLPGTATEIREQQLFRKFYMHRSSHWLGVDVHDAGRYTLSSKPRPLEIGHVLTVEPGLYIAADTSDVPEAFRGIGVRLEDDVLIGADGPEVLTTGAPKAIAELESIVGVDA